MNFVKTWLRLNKKGHGELIIVQWIEKGRSGGVGRDFLGVKKQPVAAAVWCV